jgi:hypothetical protein
VNSPRLARILLPLRRIMRRWERKQLLVKVKRILMRSIRRLLVSSGFIA